LLLTLFLSAASQAAVIPLFADLTTFAEPSIFGPTNSLTGLPRPTPRGFALFSLNTSVPQMTMTVTVFNIDITGSQTPDENDDLLNAHIHVATTNPFAPTFPVRWGFLGAPHNDNQPNQLVITPFLNAVGGTFTSIWDAREGNPNAFPPAFSTNHLATQITPILNNLAYINFHTRENMAGEIRGTLVVVPEPGTCVLLSAGLVALGIARRRRR
jgi:hypothetical protein